jgi:hypothetical protein
VLTGVSSSGALTSDVTPATINVKTHVPITLELNRLNFTHWSTFFKAMSRKFGLPSFLDPAIPARPSDPTWEQTDYAIKGWLYTSVDDFIVALAMDDPDQTTCALYATISDLFNGNKEAHALHLSNEF